MLVRNKHRKIEFIVAQESMKRHKITSHGALFVNYYAALRLLIFALGFALYVFSSLPKVDFTNPNRLVGNFIKRQLFN